MQEESEVSLASKKRRIAGGKAQVVKASKAKKGKKPVKKPTEFKKGKWNPDIQIVEQDKYRENPISKPILDCCIRCNNKNLIRAAITDNEQLLKECLAAKKKISLLTPLWSPEVKWTPIEYMVNNNQHEMLEILLHPNVKVP